MKAVTLEISELKAVGARFVNAWKTGKTQGSYIGFASVELMIRVLTERRWEILKAMAGQGPMSIRETARRVDRDVKAVHGDVRALMAAGVLSRTDDGRIEFPYDDIRVDFKLRAA
jgi:predicted transcriptional regulator